MIEIPDSFRTNVLYAFAVEVLPEELALDHHRVVGWGVAQAVLSAWWSLTIAEPAGNRVAHNGEVLARLMK